MKKILLSIFSIMFIMTTLNANNVVANKKDIYFVGKDTIYNKDNLKGSFTFIWFFDVNCPHCRNSMEELKKVIYHISDEYSDEMNQLFISVTQQNFSMLEDYFNHYDMEDLNIGYVDDFDMNKYMNVTSTPTLIVLDPYLNIVDKIEGETNAKIYNRHIDYIMNKYKKYMEEN